MSGLPGLTSYADSDEEKSSGDELHSSAGATKSASHPEPEAPPLPAVFKPPTPSPAGAPVGILKRPSPLPSPAGASTSEIPPKRRTPSPVVTASETVSKRPSPTPSPMSSVNPFRPITPAGATGSGGPRSVGSADSPSSPHKQSPQFTPESDTEKRDDEDSNPSEPPPPARPDIFQSPSPVGGSTASSPGTRDRPQELPRVASTALVSYGAEGDEEDDYPESKDDRPESGDESSAPPSSTLGSVVRKHEKGGLTMKIKQEDGDLDVDDYLERTLALERKCETQKIDTTKLNKATPRTQETEVRLPPSPKGICSPELEEKLQRFITLKLKGTDPNASIQNDKKFRNPSMYEKIIESLGIDEFGSNFSKKYYNPRGFKSSDYYDELAKKQKVLMESLEKEKAKSDGATKSEARLLGDDKKRKSKWDQPAAASAPISTTALSATAVPTAGQPTGSAVSISNIPVLTIPAPTLTTVGQAAKVAAAALQTSASAPSLKKVKTTSD